MSIATGPLQLPAIAPPGRWTVDPRHSAVEFSIKYLSVASVRGRFRDFAGTLEVGPVGDVRGHGFVKVESIDSGDPTRDGHLLSPSFLDADRYPEIKFTLREVEHVDGDVHRMRGGLTVRGVQRRIDLDARVMGVARDPSGDDRVGLELAGRFNRHEFGLRWNRLVEGTPIAGEEVRVTLSLSLVRQQYPRAQGWL